MHTSTKGADDSAAEMGEEVGNWLEGLTDSPRMLLTAISNEDEGQVRVRVYRVLLGRLWLTYDQREPLEDARRLLRVIASWWGR